MGLWKSDILDFNVIMLVEVMIVYLLNFSTNEWFGFSAVDIFLILDNHDNTYISQSSGENGFVMELQY